jgi:hypothetical protein
MSLTSLFRIPVQIQTQNKGFTSNFENSMLKHNCVSPSILNPTFVGLTKPPNVFYAPVNKQFKTN